MVPKFSINRKKKKAVGNTTTTTVAAAATTSPRKQRGVWFAEKRNTVHVFEPVNRDNTRVLESLWQQEWELEKTKQEIKQKAKKWRQTGMSAFLDNVYHCNSSSSSSSSNNNNPTLVQKQLNTLQSLPDDLYMRGAERFLNKKHDQERTNGKKSIIRDVVAHYRKLKVQVDLKTLTLMESQTMLARFSRSLNQDADKFAHRMGKADEVARRGPARTIRPAQELLEYLHDIEMERLRNGPTRITKQQQATPGITTTSRGQRQKNKAQGAGGGGGGGGPTTGTTTTQQQQHGSGVFTTRRRRIQARQA